MHKYVLLFADDSLEGAETGLVIDQTLKFQAEHSTFKPNSNRAGYRWPISHYGGNYDSMAFMTAATSKIMVCSGFARRLRSRSEMPLIAPALSSLPRWPRVSRSFLLNMAAKRTWKAYCSFILTRRWLLPAYVVTAWPSTSKSGGGPSSPCVRFNAL